MWLEDLLDFWFPRGLSDGAEDDRGSRIGERPPPTLSENRGLRSSASSLNPLPEPPEMYLRPELIPIKEPDGAAVEEAQRVLRR